MNILIIGGGIIGLTIAYELHRSGVREITVLDRSAAGTEASWAAAGMLASTAECNQFDEFYELCADSAAMYPAFADELEKASGVGIGFYKSGTLQVAFTTGEAAEMIAKHERQREAGVRSEKLSSVDALKLEPSLSPAIEMGIYYADDHRVDNRLMLAALLEYARRNSIKIVEHTNVKGLSIQAGKAAGAVTDTRECSADVTILATGAWTSDIELGPAEELEVRPIKGQMIALEGAGIDLTHVVYGPECYVVPRPGGRILVGATVEYVGFDRTVSSDVSERLHRSAIDLLPALDRYQIAESWAGFRPAARDELPLIGALTGIEGAFVATGHYRNGILLAPITARIIADEVLGIAHSKYLDVFGVSRFGKRAANSN